MGRILNGAYGSPSMSGSNGAYIVRGPCGRELKIIAGTGVEGIPWEHVSVSVEGKHPPNWTEMCWVKDQFWTDDETVVQFHPKKSEYKNLHPCCLHLWKQVGVEHPLPPLIAV